MLPAPNPIARFLLLSLLVLGAALSRLLPHPHNFTPIGALALFSGACFTSRWAAFAVPLLGLLIGDIPTGFHALTLWVYGAFALEVVIGFWLRRRRMPLFIAGGTLVGGVVFFLVTNFGVWAVLGTFPPTLEGLLECYAAGLPFFRNTLLGDFFYVSVLFGGLWVVEATFPAVCEPRTAEAGG
jgi:Family of unknown function (DUF6580)